MHDGQGQVAKCAYVDTFNSKRESDYDPQK